MTRQARVRRLQDTLGIVGVGVIAFGAWTLAKTILFLFLYNEGSIRQLYGLNDELPMEVFYIVFAVFSLFDMMVRLYVGLSARAEGLGKRKGSAYLVVAALMVALSVAGLVFMAFSESSGSPSLFDLIMTVIIEVTSIATLVLMIFSAIRLRQLSGQAG